MIHKTRVPHVVQNDADDITPHLCGAAAIQVILYGRDNSLFITPTSTQLKPGVPRRADQDTIWTAVKQMSQQYCIDHGLTGGTLDEEQVCEGTFCWATHPAVLAGMVTAGIVASNGHVLVGVPARVEALEQDEVLDAVLYSIDRGVGAAVLIDASHWVVVYRINDNADDPYMWLRDPLEGALTKWDISDWEDYLVDVDAGAFDGKCVVVTASAPVPRRREARASRRARARMRSRQMEPIVHQPMKPWSPKDAAALAETLAREEEWKIAFGGVQLLHLLPVRHQSRPDADYYLADFGKAGAYRPTIARTGGIVVDSQTLKIRMASGIEEPDQSLSRALGPDEMVDELNGREVEVKGKSGRIILKRGDFRLDSELVWKPCDQSHSMLQPFYVLRQHDPADGSAIVLFVRVDGKVFPELTNHLRGV